MGDGMIREEDLIIIGDEAWTPEEVAAKERRLARHREANRRYYARWRANNLDRAREINREHMRRKRGSVPRIPRAPQPRLVGSLHSLACTGPTKATGCRCSKIRCYDRPR